MKRIPFAAPLALGLTTAFAVPALAGSMDPAPMEPEIATPVPMAAPSLGGDWTGPYAGVQLGYGDVDASGAPVDGNGEIYGLHGGYRWDLGRTVIGAELDYDHADIDLDGAATLDEVARLKGQVGYDFGQTLAYATAGVAQADTSLGDETGYVVGGGLAWAVNPSWTVGGEVLYHDFDEFGNSGVGAEATTATLRASFRF